MENAGRGVVSAIEAHYGPVRGRSFLVVCGKGNNGGDGFVAARHLLVRGAGVTVACLAAPGSLPPDARAHFMALQAISRKSAQLALKIIALRKPKQVRNLPEADYIIDAVFGTGFHGSPEGIAGEVIRWMNGRRSVRISIDIPSGLNADTGEAARVAVKADFTVTMGKKKTGLLLGAGPSCTGMCALVDIGVPGESYPKSKSAAFLVQHEDIRLLLPRRPLNAHKYSVGKIFILAGSRGLTGAAAMTAQAAMRCGAGGVILGTPRGVYPILARKLTEVMVEPLAETPQGTAGLDALDAIQEHLRWADVVVVGPGLSRNPETQRLVVAIVRSCDKPMLVDADGLNAIAGDITVLKRRNSAELILTPHVGEFSRLARLSPGEIAANPIGAAMQFARRYGCTLVLKGAPSVTAAPDGSVVVNATGNPGMATAGSGDVLSGIIAALRGQGLCAAEAAYGGVYLHGLAGDLAAAKFTQMGMMAMDIHDCIPAAIQHIVRPV
jgi:hydroxyethylthiazole kinase-like uncharacterized protein yjeF